MLFNLLHINLDKSCFKYFPLKRKFVRVTHVDKKCSLKSSKGANTIVEKTNAPIYIGENTVKEVTEVRFLGIIFDPLLDWSTHIHYLKKKLRISFAIIKRITSYIPTTNYKCIYHTLFESRLSYCISTWGGAKTKKLIDQVFTIQKILPSDIYLATTISFLRNLAHQHAHALMVSSNLELVFIEKNIQTHSLMHKKLLLYTIFYIYMAVNEISKLLTLRCPAILLEQIKLSYRNKENRIIIESSC